VHFESAFNLAAVLRAAAEEGRAEAAERLVK
jgi:hypothetical protein